MTTLTAHERRIFLMMMLASYTLRVWHEQAQQDIELNERPMPRLTWTRLLDWLDEGLITLATWEDFLDGSMIYGVYKLTEAGRQHTMAVCS